MAYRIEGLILQKITHKDIIRNKLDAMFLTTDHNRFTLNHRFSLSLLSTFFFAEFRVADP